MSNGARTSPEKRYDTMVSSGQSTLKALLTLNGGSTIAFLTFLGNYHDKLAKLQNADPVIAAVQLFLVSTFLGVLAYGFIFVTNVFSYKRWETATDRMFIFTVVTGAASIACFCRASWFAIAGFRLVLGLAK